MHSNPKILIVRFSSMGDIVLTTPIVRCLKEQLDHPEIHYITKEPFAQILECNPNIDKVWTIKNSIGEVSGQLKAVGFNYVVDLHNNIRSKQLKSAIGSKSGTLKKHNVRKWLLVNLGIDNLPDVHVVDRYFETVRVLGVEDDGKGLDFFFPADFSLKPDLAIEGDYVVAVIGGKHPGKKLPVEKWREIIERTEYSFVLIGGEEDRQAAQEIAKGNENVVSRVGDCTVFGSARLIEGADCVISNDTGMMHVAAAFKKDIISLWGQTTPKFGMYPYLPGDKSVMIEPEGTRKLSKLGNKKESKPSMRTISTEKILRAMNEIMKD